MNSPERAPSRRATIALRAAAAAWSVAAVASLGALGAHAARPGDPGDAPARWPAASRIPRATDRPTLLLFLDARCPCAAASRAELARLLARAPGPVTALVVSAGGPAPDGPVPGARHFDDPRAEETGRFGVATSGHALLFGRDGRLLFGGGITPARGHEGENFGASAIVAHLAGRAAPPGAPVFGCPITGPAPDDAEDRR